MLELGEYLTIGEALLISGISIAIVFVVLSVIATIISLIGKMFQEEKTTPVAKAQSPSQNNEGQIQPKVDLSSVVKDEHKLVAIIVATMAANENDGDVKYKITSIKEI